MGMYVYSTASSDQKFNLFAKIEKGDIPRISGFVVIKGRANIANKNLITEKGVATSISDADFKLLEKSSSYQKMVSDGFLKSDAKRMDAEVVAKDLTARDNAAPLQKVDAEKNGVSISDETSGAA